jgi:RNA polymerase sigma factor for flagellar operon FliA
VGRGQVEALVRQNLPLVQHIVFQVAARFPAHVDRKELADAGTLGLLEAAWRYDESRGIPFERFATQRIRGAIIDSTRSRDWVPRSVRAAGRELEATTIDLQRDLSRMPEDAEIARAMDMSVADLRVLRSSLRRAVLLHLDKFLTDDDDDEARLVDTLVDRTLPEPEEVLETKEIHGYLRDAVRLLPERLRRVVVEYFLDGRSMGEIARDLGVTESRVSQMRGEALGMLHDAITAQFDPDSMASHATAKGRAASRRAAYVAQVSTASSWQARLESGSLAKCLAEAAA